MQMFQNPVPLVLAMLVLIAACKKKEEGPADPNAGSTARFKVTGVKDVDLSLSSNGRIGLPLEIVTNPGAQPDTVSLQVSDLPLGISTTFSPATGKTSFSSRIQFINNYNGPGGSFPISIQAIGNSGNLSYPLTLSVPGFIGWTFNDTVYSRARVVKDAGFFSGYPYIYADDVRGSRLVVNFPYRSELPKSPVTYKIGPSTTEGTIQLQFIRDSTQVFVSTAEGSPTASFVFDSLGKFILKCSDVRMSNGFRSGKLQVNIPE